MRKKVGTVGVSVGALERFFLAQNKHSLNF